MTSENKVVLHMEGPAQNDHHLELSVFMRKLSQFHNLLKGNVEESDKNHVAFQVVKLSHSSPVTMECVPIGENRESEATAIRRIQNNFDSVEREETADVPARVLAPLEELCNFKQPKIARVEVQTSIGGEDRTFALNEQFRSKLKAARRAETEEFSTVDGKLEQIDIHGQPKKFKIYNFSSSVSCEFDNKLLKEVQGALDRNVSVSGKCFYRPGSAFPYKIIVSAMEMLPLAEDLPSLMDLFGIAPDATGEKSSEQFVRDLRDNWGEVSE